MHRTVSRRHFVRHATGLALSAGIARRADAADKLPVIVDCHAHIYGQDEKKYPTIDQPYRPPQGTGTVVHLQREMQANAVRYVTAIQTSTFYRWDNRFTIDSARAHKDSMVAVCTLDPDDENSSSLLEEYVRGGSVRGMRSVPARGGRLDDPGVENLWAMAERLGIVINVLANREKRREIEKLARRFPRLQVVIDHCLNIKSGAEMGPTVQDMVALARLPNVHAKLSFIPTGSAEDYPCRDMHAACLRIIGAFGPQRCVWGSDFPCELWCPKVTYTQHLKIFTKELGLNAPSQREILGGTAQRLWFRQLGSW